MLLSNIKQFKTFAIIQIVLLLFLMQSFSGCVSIRTHATSLEPSAHPAPNTSSGYEKIEDTELMASSFSLLWFIPVTPEPNINQVIENKIIESGGDNIIKMKIWHERQIWILGTVNIIHVKGTIVRYTD